MSEWMKIMLDEIARKKAEAEQARIEEQRRAEDLPTEQCYSPPSAPRE